MEPLLTTLFKNLPNSEVPLSLEPMILTRIKRAAHQREQMTIFGFGLLGIVSFVALWDASLYLREGFISSGILNYLSLIFSEGTSTTAFLKELLLTILESLPLTALSLTLFFLVTTLTSFKKCMEGVPRSFFSISLS